MSMKSIAIHRTDVFREFIMALITMLLTKSYVVMLTDDTSQIETASPRAVMFPAYTQCLLRGNEYIHNIMSYSRRVTQKQRNRQCRTSVGIKKAGKVRILC